MELPIQPCWVNSKLCTGCKPAWKARGAAHRGRPPGGQRDATSETLDRFSRQFQAHRQKSPTQAFSRASSVSRPSVARLFNSACPLAWTGWTQRIGHCCHAETCDNGLVKRPSQPAPTHLIAVMEDVAWFSKQTDGYPQLWAMSHGTGLKTGTEDVMG